MTAKILDGKKISAEIKEELRTEVEILREKGLTPGLAVIMVGADPASGIYVRNKKKAAEKLGIFSMVRELGENATEEEVVQLIEKLNEDDNIHGILVQLPLPEHIDARRIIVAISPKKDVDCFHPENVGRVITGGAVFYPCTPAGIVELMKRSGVEIAGKNCVIIGRSNIVGKPVALMMMKENATVTIAHSKTKNLAETVRSADIVIAAVGKAKMITADMVKDGAVVVDVGINRLADGKLAGDVDFEEASKKASFITPVPGGVGPMTIAMLMKNTIEAAKLFEQE